MGDTEFVKTLDSETGTRLRLRVTTASGRVVFFVVQLEILVDSEWRVVVRYDNSHGFTHRDEFDARGRETKKEIRLPDCAAAVQYAEQDLIDRW
ncbi:MAG: hypothetical protein FJ087_19430 [Deltaproteobacteria bacterium]|nr:hypothetical protein [Deltaproteobacteria bacterium]